MLLCSVCTFGNVFIMLCYCSAAAAAPLPPPPRGPLGSLTEISGSPVHLAQDALIAKTRETIRGWRDKLEALVAEHEALAGDVGPAGALSPQSPKA